MQVVATMLVGPGTEELIREALVSVAGLYDSLCVIDTRPDSHESDLEEIVAMLGKAGPTVFFLERFDWRNDFSAARNFALDCATKCGGTHALTIDTDERLSVDRDEWARCVAVNEAADLFELRSSDHSYAKERLIRLGSFPEWIGPTHERLQFHRDKLGKEQVGIAMLPGSFSEPQKTPEQLKHKFERDVSVLLGWLQEQPNRATSRWYRYLGESYFGLEQFEKAYECFYRAAHDDRGSREERAWACFRSGECNVLLGRYREAVESGAWTLALHAGLAREAGYVAAWACAMQNEAEQALYWALMGINCPPTSARRGSVHPGALTNCWRIVARCAQALGYVKLLDEAQNQLGIANAANITLPDPAPDR